MIHHLALGSQRVQLLADFYQEICGLKYVDQKFDAEGKLRSIWLQLSPHSVLMIESSKEPVNPRREEVQSGLFLLCFSRAGREEEQLAELLGSWDCRIESRSEHSLYFRDPDGNRLAFSDYPLPVSVTS